MKASDEAYLKFLERHVQDQRIPTIRDAFEGGWNAFKDELGRPVQPIKPLAEIIHEEASAKAVQLKEEKNHRTYNTKVYLASEWEKLSPAFAERNGIPDNYAMRKGDSTIGKIVDRDGQMVVVRWYTIESFRAAQAARAKGSATHRGRLPNA